jgi:hypothetical protein
MDTHIFSFEGNPSPSFEPRCNQIFDDFLLGIDRNRASCQLFEIDAMTASVEADFHAIMDQPFPLHSVAHTHFGQQIHGAVLQDSGSDALFTVRSTSSLNQG